MHTLWPQHQATTQYVGDETSWIPFASCLVHAADNGKRECGRGTDGEASKTSTAVCGPADEDRRCRPWRRVSTKLAVNDPPMSTPTSGPSPTDLDDRVRGCAHPLLLGGQGQQDERLKGKASKMLGDRHVQASATTLQTGQAGVVVGGGWVIVGCLAQSVEHVVIGENGVYKTRTIRRVPEEERWDRVVVEEVKFTPWMFKERSTKEKLDGSQEDGHRTSVDTKINKETRRRSSRSLVALKVALVALPPRSAERGGALASSGAARGWRSTFGRSRLRKRERERERVCVQRVQELVNKHGLKRKDEEPKGTRRRSQSRSMPGMRKVICQGLHSPTRCHCRSGHPLPRLPQKEVKGKHLLLVVEGTWTRIGRN